MPETKSPAASPHPHLKSPGVAAFLSLLVPGLGHAFQGRWFKACLYFLCIYGTFFFGQALGDWKVVYMDWHQDRRTWAYVCQFWTGVVAWPALAQTYVRPAPFFLPRLNQPTTANFTGRLGETSTVSGQVTLVYDETAGFPRIVGDFNGTLTNAQGTAKPLKGKLTDVSIEPQIAPDPRRYLKSQFESAEGGDVRGEIHGSIPRPLTDWYGAPLQDSKGKEWQVAVPHDPRSMLERAHADLGSRFELGVLYTMVAGLLNILCLFDALEGPAYENDEEKEPLPDGLPVPA